MWSDPDKPPKISLHYALLDGHLLKEQGCRKHAKLAVSLREVFVHQ